MNHQPNTNLFMLSATLLALVTMLGCSASDSTVVKTASDSSLFARQVSEKIGDGDIVIRVVVVRAIRVGKYDLDGISTVNL